MATDKYEVGILTVINPELDAVQKTLRIDNTVSRINENGDIYWSAKLFSQIMNRDLSIILHCLSAPGQSSASTGATKLIDRFDPAFMLLVGIAAGRKHKIKIGDVAIPRSVFDYTQTVAAGEKKKLRPSITMLPHAVAQMIRSFSMNEDQWHAAFTELFQGELQAPPGQENEYNLYVAKRPQLNECTIASADILLRNGFILDDLANNNHQDIKAGDMEAAGFITACNGRLQSVPWLVIRGISDFGDEFKNDSFHRLAACAAASYAKYFLCYGFDLRNLQRPVDVPAQPNAYEISTTTISKIIDLLNKCILCVDGYRTIDYLSMDQLSNYSAQFCSETNNELNRTYLQDLLNLLISYNRLPRRPGESQIIIAFLKDTCLLEKLNCFVHLLERSKS